MRRSRSRAAGRLAAGLVAAATAAAALTGCAHGQATADRPARAATTGAPTAPASTAPEVALGSKPTCAETDTPFRPRTIAIPGVTRGAPVIAPPRDAHGVPGVPPLTNDGKLEFAWDRAQGIRPGDPHGNVLLNAHTWPDGSALGNRMLAHLHKGDRIVVRGAGRRAQTVARASGCATGSPSASRCPPPRAWPATTPGMAGPSSRSWSARAAGSAPASGRTARSGSPHRTCSAVHRRWARPPPVRG